MAKPTSGTVGASAGRRVHELRQQVAHAGIAVDHLDGFAHAVAKARGPPSGAVTRNFPTHASGRRHEAIRLADDVLRDDAVSTTRATPCFSMMWDERLER